MDSRIEEIVAGLQRLLKNAETAFIAAVEKDNSDTLDVKDFNGTAYLKVRKIATEGAKGFIVTPPVGSYVVVSRIAGSDDLFVSMYSEIERIECITTGKIAIKNSDYSIKQAFDELIDAIGKLTVTTGVGPSGIPINKTEFDSIKQKINKLLS